MNGLRRGARRPTPVGDRMRARSWPTIAVAQSLAGVAACSPHHDRASIEVDRPVALADAPVHLRVGGLAAGEEVTISAQAHDAGGKVWRSQAQFTAGDGGVVDLDRDRPTSGTYQGIDGMGLFWSMNPPDGDPEQAIYVPPEAGSFTVDLAVAAGGRQLATRTLTRRRRRDGVTVRALRMDTDQVAGLLALPPAGSPPPVAVLAIGGSDGGVGLAALAGCSPPTAIPRSRWPTSTTPAGPTSSGTSRWNTSRPPRGAWPPSPACGVAVSPPWATRAAPRRRCCSARGRRCDPGPSRQRPAARPRGDPPGRRRGPAGRLAQGPGVSRPAVSHRSREPAASPGGPTWGAMRRSEEPCDA